MFGTLHTVQFHSVSCTNRDVIATIPTGHLHVQYTSQTAVSLRFLNKLKCHCCNRKQVIYMFSTLYILQLNSVPWTNPSVAGAASDHGTYMMQTQAPSSFLSLWHSKTVSKVSLQFKEGYGKHLASQQQGNQVAQAKVKSTILPAPTHPTKTDTAVHLPFAACLQGLFTGDLCLTALALTSIATRIAATNATFKGSIAFVAPFTAYFLCEKQKQNNSVLWSRIPFNPVQSCSVQSIPT